MMMIFLMLSLGEHVLSLFALFCAHGRFLEGVTFSRVINIGCVT